MTIDILPVTLAARLAPWPRRWLVYQTDARGKLVYGQAFTRRTAAEKAAKAANERVRLLGSRMPAGVTRLPHDRR